MVIITYLFQEVTQTRLLSPAASLPAFEAPVLLEIVGVYQEIYISEQYSLSLPADRFRPIASVEEGDQKSMWEFAWIRNEAQDPGLAFGVRAAALS